MANDNDRLVVAYYSDAQAARAAADDLKTWDKANDAIKLGAIGIITLNEHSGEIEVQEVGQRNLGKGALWGTAIGAGLGILTAGIALIPGLVAGAAIGAGVGALDHKGLGMDDETVHDLAAHLRSGGAALGVMCDDFEVEATMARMLEDGGKVNHFELHPQTSAVISGVAAAQKAASSAVDRAAEEAAKAGDDERQTAVNLLAATGLSASAAANLVDAGLSRPSALLEQGSSPQGRKELAAETGLSENEVLVVIKKMDLMRINGVGVVYADLLHAAGVETVPDLARRNPANLTSALDEANKNTAITEELPGEASVADWVAQAQELPRVIAY